MPNYQKKIIYLKSFDGEKLRVSLSGELENPQHTYLLLSGIGGGITSWEFFIAELLTKSPTAKCVTFDFRGHALSSHRFPHSEDSLFSVYAKDTCEVITQVCKSDKKWTIVGHSMGGLVIQEILGKNPECIPHKIVLICSPQNKTFFPRKLLFVWYKLLAAWSLFFHAKKDEMSLEQHLQYKDSHDFSIWRISQDILSMGLVTFLFLWLSNLSWQMNVTTQLREKTLLLIFGTRDHIVTKKMQQKIITELPNSVVAFVDTGHNAVVNRPKELATAVASFSLSL